MKKNYLEPEISVMEMLASDFITLSEEDVLIDGKDFFNN